MKLRCVYALLIACTPDVSPSPQTPSTQVFAPRAMAPPTLDERPHHIRVRVFAVRHRGSMPADESGPWDLTDAPHVVANLNTVSAETTLTFSLEGAFPLDVDDSLAEIPPTSDGARRAFDVFAATGKLTNDTLSVIVMSLNTTWVQGWGNIDQPLHVRGSWPIILASTRVARSEQAHWVAHELGHVIGFFDTTFYDAAPRSNAPYSRCGLSLPSTTYPLNAAPMGARHNIMSYNVDERSAFFTEGYDWHRLALACFVRESGL